MPYRLVKNKSAGVVKDKPACSGQNKFGVDNYAGNLVESISARHSAEAWTEDYTEKFEYDYANRVTKAYNIFGDYASTEYDELGRKISVTDIAGNKATVPYSTLFEYDVLGRLVKQQVPFEDISGTIYYSESKTYYDLNGNVVKSLVANNEAGDTTTYKQSEYAYDSRNRLVTVSSFENTTDSIYTQYWYDNAGNKLRMYTGLSDPITITALDTITNGTDTVYSTTKYEYDRFGNLTKWTDPLGQYEEYTYDYNGNLTEKTDRNGNLAEYQYDGLNRLLSEYVSNPYDTNAYGLNIYTYALTGAKQSMYSSGLSYTYEYGERGQLLNEYVSDGVEKEYSYDTAGNSLSLTLTIKDIIKSDLDYTYDKLNRLSTVQEGAATKATYTYDDNGNRASLAYPENSTIYSYNLANSITSLTNKQGTTTISNYTYEYTLDGNRIKESETVDLESTEYIYDRLGRLLTETEKDNDITVESYSYTYDDYSNRATKSVQTGGTTTYTYDVNNRLLKESTINGSVTLVTNYGYDNNGNQITTWDEEEETNGTGTPSAHLEIIGEDTEPKATYNVYNGFNQLVKTNTGNIRAEYTYNADGLRTTKTVNGAETRHIWSGANIIFEMSSIDEVQYIRGINLICMDDGTTESFYMFNAHGDVVHLTSSSTGAITKDYTYDAFGIEENPDSADQNPFRYCGEYFDKSSNTYYLRARYYNPAIGRFISEDTYWGDSADPLSLNLYIYCANNPIVFWDPSGHKIELSEEATVKQTIQYYRAIEYLRTSEEATALIDALENLPDTITIVINEDTCDGYSFGDKRTNWTYDGTNILNWNPYLGLVLGNKSSVLSPALALAHEMGHAYQDLIENLLPPNNQPITDIERAQLEQDNMERFELPIANQLGEYTRADYNDRHPDMYKRYFTTNSSTDWGSLTGKYNHWFLYYWFHPSVVKVNDREFINQNMWQPNYGLVTKPLLE